MSGWLQTGIKRAVELEKSRKLKWNQGTDPCAMIHRGEECRGKHGVTDSTAVGKHGHAKQSKRCNYIVSAKESSLG